jgi:hypothetical protein
MYKNTQYSLKVCLLEANFVPTNRERVALGLQLMICILML